MLIRGNIAGFELSMLALLYVFLTTPLLLRAEDDICRLFRDGTKIRKPGSCSEYITCHNSTSTLNACDDNLIYDLNKKTCVKKGLVPDDSYCRYNCEGKDNYWLADLTSCNGFYYCSNGVGAKSFCPEGYLFDESKQMCMHSDDSLCVEVANICQVVPVNVKFRNEANCNSYYECKEVRKKLILNKVDCKFQEYFDVQRGKCHKKQEVFCEKHPFPKRVCGVNGKAKRGVYVSDQISCRGYFYCADLGYVADISPAWGLCPEGTFFHEKAQRCTDPQLTPCPYNRCEGRGTRLVESSSNNCHNYWVCENGIPKEERTCPGDLFFNSYREVCARNPIYDPSCDRKASTKPKVWKKVDKME